MGIFTKGRFPHQEYLTALFQAFSSPASILVFFAKEEIILSIMVLREIEDWLVSLKAEKGTELSSLTFCLTVVGGKLLE